MSATDTELKVQISALQAFPSALKLTKLTQQVTLTVPASAVVQQRSSAAGGERLLSAFEGEPVVVWTQPALVTTKAMLGTDGALSAALVQLG
jgi:hypothetical protein